MRTARLISLIALSCAACGGADVDFAIFASTPSGLCRPEVDVHVDESGVLHWSARGVRPLMGRSAYTLWLVDQGFAIESCSRVGTLAISGDGSAHGSYSLGTSTIPAVRRALSQPEQNQMLVTLESDANVSSPNPGTFHIELWSPTFPRAGDPIPTSFAFGDGLRERRLEDFISASGVLNSPWRGFARVEMNYPTNRIVARFWNFKTPIAGRVFVLWATDGSLFAPLAVIRQFPELQPTRPSEVNGFEPTDSELRMEVTHDPALLPYDRFLEIMMTYESATPNDEYISPLGVVVMRGHTLAHGLLLDFEGGGHGGHGGGGGADCAPGGAGHAH